MTTGARVVFDCNIFLQALAAPQGPSGRCIELAIRGKVILFLSPWILEEFRKVTSRPRVIAKLRLVENRVEEFLQAIESVAAVLNDFPQTFTYPRDPDDANYINLALAADARLVISRDKDLLDLMDLTKPEAAEFRQHYPTLRILNPTQFLNEVGTETK